MEFEGEDQRNLNELVRTLSGRLDLLIDQPPQRAAGGGGGGGSTSAEESRGPSLSEDEPPECRVCRGEPEPGRRLYAPCLCSGSIMHTHEDCLLEWLEHSGKDTCELCGAQFHFTPVYDPDAPQYVPIYQVLSTCARKAVVKWLPLLVRVVMVAVLWVVFVPVCTSWLYRIWIHRTRVLLPQLFLQRLNAACIWSDCISGIIVTAAIILSFLSLMTFADFLADQLLRDDFGGIGLDGMNLVEAMAEGLDELRFDNNNNHNHDRAPPPPQEALLPDPPQGDRGFHRGGGGGGGGGANAAPFVPPADAAPTVHETRIRTPSVGAAEGAVNAGRDYHNGNFVQTMDAAYASMGDRGVAEPVSRSRTNDDGSPGDRGHVANEHRANKNNGAFGGVRGVGSGEGKSPTVNRGGTEPRAGSTETGRRSNATDFASSGEWHRGRKASGPRASHGVWLDDHEEKWEKEEEEKEGDKATRAAFVELNSRPPTPPRKARMEDAGTSYEALSAVSAAAEVTAGARGAAARSGSGHGSGRGSGRSSGNGKGEPPHGAGGAMHQAVAMTGIDPVAAASAPSVGREGLIDRKYGRTPPPPPPPPPTRATNAEAAQSSMRGPDDDLASAVSTNGASGSSAMARATERGSVGNAQPQDRLPMEQAEPAAAAVAGAGAGAALGAGPGPGLGPGADRAQEPPPLLGEEDDLDDLEDGFLDGDLDVHMAIDELLGIRGPVTVLLRNVLWLLAFHGAYLGLFAFFPFSIGASVIHAISKYLDPHVLASLGRRSEYLALRDVVQEWFVLATSSEEQEDTLRLSDLATICLGYMVMSAMVFMWRGIINAISNRTNTQILLRAKKAMRVISAVVKVGLLLSLKMLLLPLLLGVCLDATTLSLFGRTGESRARFMAQHLVGSLLLHWVLGITFMLFVTVSVLQLREVVHPELLSLIIRPQEPHPDLLGSLLQESGRTHARRMAMSLAIYLALVVMFVWVPTRLVGALFPSIMPVQLELRYGMPQLQIPAELVILHLAMLTFLERYQNRIGEMQHAWLVAACGRLGLTRYVLPQPVVARLTRPRRPTDGVSDAAALGGINNPAVSGVVPGTDAGANFGADGGAGASSLRRRWTSSRGPARQGASSATRGDGRESAGGGGGEADGGVGGGRGWGAKLKAWWDGGEAGKDEEEGIIVGPPLRRPPTGWDDPAGVAQGRWAWGTEPPGEVQLNLAPRRRHGARVVPLMALLLLAAWVTVLVVSMCILVLPFLVGRLVFSLLHLPRHWTHDTASFAVGLTLLKAAIPSLYRGWCMAREAFLARNRHAAADLVVFASELATRTEASIATLRAERDEMLRRMAYEVGRRGGGRELDQLQQHVQEQNENIEKLVQQLNRLNDETAVARASALRDQQLLRQQQQPHTDTNSDDVDPQLRAAAAVGAAATAATATAARRKSTVRGATTLLAAAVLWLVVAPLLAAGLYETAFVVTAQEWASKGPLGALPCWNQPVRTLALGVFLLHVWVYFCRARIPRWVAAAMWAVGVGVGGARGAGHGEAAPQLGGGGAGADADGGAALQEPDRQSFWGARIEAALLQIEAGLSWGRWSEVSARPLLGNFVGAVVLRLFAMIAISATVSLAAGAWTGPDGADGQLVQLRHFRAALLALVLTRASTYLIKPTQVWLKALHDGVRDDRYLVGMRLQDHSDKGQDTGVGDNSNNVEGMAAAAAAAAATTAGLG